MTSEEGSESTSTGIRTRRQRRRKRLTIALLVAGLASVAIHFGCTHWLPRAIVTAPNYGRTIAPEPDVLTQPASTAGGDQTLYVSVGDPPATLSVRVMDPGVPARGTILVLHGIRAGKWQMTGVGQQLADHGFRAVLVDLRGHGESTGDWLTFGVRESQDLMEILDALDRQGLLEGKVGAYGASYGAATSIMLAGCDPRIAAVVAVAPYSSMTEIVPRYIRRYLPWGWCLSDRYIKSVIARAGRLASFDPDAASPAEAIGRTQAQVLLIHGREDNKIPCDHSRRLHAAGSDHAHLIIIDGEDHDSIMRDRSGVLMRETLAWFDRWLAPAIAHRPTSGPAS